jgi:hypothetical protein
LFASFPTTAGQWLDIDARNWPAGVILTSFEGTRSRGFSRILIP